MREKTNLIGRRIGSLVVTSPAPSRNRNTYWTVTCDCGRVCEQPKSALIASPPKIKSCGCLREDYLNRERWERIARNRQTLLHPMGYFPKSKQGRFPTKSRPFWICLCGGCHKFVKTYTTALENAQAISCSDPACIYRAETLLKLEDSELYAKRCRHLTRNSYNAMVQRSGTDENYLDVKVHPPWLGPSGFETFIKDVGLRPHRKLSLDRPNPFGHYEPGNVSWADAATQSRNKRNSVKYRVDGNLVNQEDIARYTDSTSRKLRQRIDRMVAGGLTPDEAAERIIANAHCARP